MTESRPSPWLKLATAIVIVGALTPLVLRGWPLIVQMLPIWGRMLREAAILVVGGIVLAAIAAWMFTRWRGSGGSKSHA